MVIFLLSLALALFDPFFFIGYLVSIAIFGLYQAIFMANAGGAKFAEPAAPAAAAASAAK